ncbi:unnamed protein product [Rangifer tarandus platyrhynchus]|uniref:Uncharacterized protein n=3 Tax=Rangifer tarandus platyrhynchus TaxID=3082113 RepID=A0ACB0E3M7_RANTA|nr:unnamed protein product [Rangifer tarandus platyrhynchus]CAI9695029.1 unnamed protein product [Rangifer tarandus platyrhynchus]
MLVGDGEELEGAAQGFLDDGSDKPNPARSTSLEAKWCDSHPVEGSRASNPENQIQCRPTASATPGLPPRRPGPLPGGSRANRDRGVGHPTRKSVGRATPTPTPGVGRVPQLWGWVWGPGPDSAVPLDTSGAGRKKRRCGCYGEPEGTRAARSQLRVGVTSVEREAPRRLGELDPQDESEG